jgi:hypothetical protein
MKKIAQTAQTITQTQPLTLRALTNEAIEAVRAAVLADRAVTQAALEVVISDAVERVVGVRAGRVPDVMQVVNSARWLLLQGDRPATTHYANALEWIVDSIREAVLEETRRVFDHPFIDDGAAQPVHHFQANA